MYRGADAIPGRVTYRSQTAAEVRRHARRTLARALLLSLFPLRFYAYLTRPRHP